MQEADWLFTDIDPDRIALEAGWDPRACFVEPCIHGLGGTDLRPLVEDMSGDAEDRANPTSAIRERPGLEGFTLALLDAAGGGRAIAMLSGGFTCHQGELDVRLDLVFTDAEYRGEGLGTLATDILHDLAGRVVSTWEDLPRTRGPAPERIVLSACVVSRGGEAIVARLAERLEGLVPSEALPEPG